MHARVHAPRRHRRLYFQEAVARQLSHRALELDIPGNHFVQPRRCVVGEPRPKQLVPEPSIAKVCQQAQQLRRVRVFALEAGV